MTGQDEDSQTASIAVTGQDEDSDGLHSRDRAGQGFTDASIAVTGQDEG